MFFLSHTEQGRREVFCLEQLLGVREGRSMQLSHAERQEFQINHSPSETLLDLLDAGEAHAAGDAA